MINRFDRPVQKDWTYPESIVPRLPTLNYEMLDQMLGQQQSQFDLARTISEKQPQVLQTEGDLALYNQYKQMVDTGLQSVTDAYANKGAAEGSRAYREYVNGIRKAWQPNGVASALTDRYTSYYNAKKQIDDFYKDDPRNVNKTLSIKALQDQLNKPIDYQDGKYNQIVTPQTYKDPDFRKAINDMIKQIDESGDTQFLGNRNKDFWIEKIKSSGKGKAQIEAAVQALSEQPEFAAQIQRDAQYQALSIDPAKYQEQFNAKLDKQFAQNEKLLSGKNAKKLLEDQGYDASNLAEAKKQFLQDQKDATQSQKDNFNLQTQLSRDVSEDYKNYAAGFATKKIDRDLIANQAVKWQMENARSRERNNALFGIRDALAPQPVPTGTVTSGIAQQLPTLDKHVTDLKKQQADIKNSVDKILTDPTSTFNGWKMEDVAAAQNVWKSTMDRLPSTASPEQKRAAFNQALQASGTYQWKPEQLDKVFNEFSSVDGPAIAPALQQYQETQYEIERVDNARTNVALQFIDTPEGKQSFELIKGFKKPNESNEQLIQRVLANPEQFNVKPYKGNGFNEAGVHQVSYNPAETFKNQMQRGVKENKAGVNYNWGDMATTEISFNADDKIMGPFIKTVGQAVEGGSQFRYMSEGKQGLTFRTNDGSEIPVGSEDRVNITSGKVARDESGTPIMKFDATVTRGNKTYQTTVNMDIVPGSTEQEQVLSGLKNTYVNIYNSGNIKSANAVLDNIFKIEKPGSLSDASTQLQVKTLTKAKAKPLNNVYKEVPDGHGGTKLTSASYWGYSGIDTHNDYQVTDPKTGAVLNHKTYAVIDQSGNKKIANVYVAPNGTEVLLSMHDNMSSVTQERLGDKIRAETPVVRESVKMPNGEIINLAVNQATDE